ncbi:meteorin-like protein [Bacillus rossius redtenbacheri]|uniref:meteorin-like protein n=1 Tax=Bacillus rossius redtenbacheri TaxID=93214 RepID=UPI002FDEE058
MAAGRCDSAPTSTAVLLPLLLALASGAAAASVMGDECDWSGSGLSAPERAVTPVYLRCAQGRLHWAYPRGALRVVLRLGASGREFRGCVRASGAPRGTARVLVEAPRARLTALLSEPQAAPRCFHSRGGQAALYVEALRSAPPQGREVLALDYHLEPLPRGRAAYDPAEECRPCTTEEMGHAYCTSDLVARGIIQAVENDEALEVSRMTVKLTKLLRHSTPDNDPEGGLALLDEERRGNSVEAAAAAGRDRRVRMHVASHCGARHGPGEFVLMARRKLGDLVLTCAPRLEDWAEVVSRTNRDGSAHCVLES